MSLNHLNYLLLDYALLNPSSSLMQCDLRLIITCNAKCGQLLSLSA